ncbi:MAG: hypothetical protein R2769_17340 [Saprospiraceae bacterium]
MDGFRLVFATHSGCKPFETYPDYFIEDTTPPQIVCPDTLIAVQILTNVWQLLHFLQFRQPMIVVE